MLVEPTLERAAVAEALKREYGRAVSAIQFVPVGESAWCYSATDDRGARWFVKLARPGELVPARVEFAVAVSQALADLGLPVPRPLPTLAGALWSSLNGLQMTVVEFVAGTPLSDEEMRSPGVLGQTARLVAGIHRCTPALAVPIPFTERFEVWPDGLRRCLARLESGAARGLVQEARELVWPQRAALLGRLERLQALGNAVRSRPRDWVLCHGDLIGDNLLRDRGGRLWLVDWDGAVLAPRELDVALFTGQEFARFLDGYQRDAGGCDLDADVIAFFLLRRNHEDLVDWLLAVLDDEQPEAQRRADLDGVRWCLACWEALQKRIQHARSVLARDGVSDAATDSGARC
jgi:spectinomycin phosphotransferase